MLGMDLKPFNTFGVSVQAPNFSIVRQISEIPTNLENALVLGEGANVLFTKDYQGQVLKNELKGIKQIDEVTFEVASGEKWHEFVMMTVDQGLSGIENMALIPGTIGAAATGNIAAYGQNFGESVVSVKLSGGETRNVSECDFTYRNSNLHEVFVTSVTLKLSKQYKFDTNYYGSKPYESLQNELSKIGKPPYTPKQVAQAVINQRKIKMPDWHKIGTDGSFFKNPFVTKTKFDELKKQVPDLQAYPVDKMLYPNPDDPVFQHTDMVKIPVGKLLDVLGWRGKRVGNVGTFEKHALIIVNFGGATGLEILEFSQKMQEDIKRNFDIDLEPEVKII